MTTFYTYAKCETKGEKSVKDYIALPKPKVKGFISVEEVLDKRRSIRQFLKTPLNIYELSQILWAAYGTNTKDGKKTTPSAGATYPLEIYIVAKNFEDLKEGLYKYISENHSLKVLKEGDFLNQLAETTYQPEMCKNAAALLVITSVNERTTSVYGQRGMRYIYMEAGHSAQNISLQGVALGIGSVLVGAFDDSKVSNALSLKRGEMPLYIIPIGKTDRYGN